MCGVCHIHVFKFSCPFLVSLFWRRYSDCNSIGYLPTNFQTGISEKAAQGRRAEYGAKTYTTDVIGKCIVAKSDDNKESDAKFNNLAFNPFNDYQVASVHDKGILNIWELPQSYSNIGDIDKPILTIDSLSDKATCLAYHPSVSDVIAVGGNKSVFICDTKQGKTILTINDLSADVTALEWLPNGSLLRVVTSDGKLYSFDPRKEPKASDSVVGMYFPFKYLIVIQFSVFACLLERAKKHNKIVVLCTIFTRVDNEECRLFFYLPLLLIMTNQLFLIIELLVSY